MKCALAVKIAKAPGSTLVATKTMIRRAWELMGMRIHQQMSNDMVAVVAGHKDFQARLAELRASGKKPRDATKDEK